MKRSLLVIIIAVFALKLIYFLFALSVSEFGHEYQIEGNKDDFFSLFKRNDSYWYQKAAEQGYPEITNPLDLGYSSGKYFKQSVWAHFPFYPLSVRYTEKILNLDFNYSAFILSILFAFTAFTGFYLLCTNVFKINEKDSLLYTLFFISFPFHYYYSMYYTEAMFFTFLAFSFISISCKKYWLTSVLILPLTLLRPNGIICLIPLIIYFIEEEGGFRQIYNYLKSYDLKKIRGLLFFLSAPLALGIYCIYQKHMTGYYFAFIKAQSGWYKEFMFPLLALFRRSDISTQFNSVYTIVFMLICIIAWKKLPLSMNVLIWINILLPMTSGSVACMPRYLSVVFPVTVLFGSYFNKYKWRYLFLITLFCLQLVTFYPWLISHPFSF